MKVLILLMVIVVAKLGVKEKSGVTRVDDKGPEEDNQIQGLPRIIKTGSGLFYQSGHTRLGEKIKKALRDIKHKYQEAKAIKRAEREIDKYKWTVTVRVKS